MTPSPKSLLMTRNDQPPLRGNEARMSASPKSRPMNPNDQPPLVGNDNAERASGPVTSPRLWPSRVSSGIAWLRQRALSLEAALRAPAAGTHTRAGGDDREATARPTSGLPTTAAAINALPRDEQLRVARAASDRAKATYARRASGEAVIQDLVDVGLFARGQEDELPGIVNVNYAEFNDTKKDIDRRLKRDRLRKSRKAIPRGIRLDSQPQSSVKPVERSREEKSSVV